MLSQIQILAILIVLSQSLSAEFAEKYAMFSRRVGWIVFIFLRITRFWIG